MAAHSKIRFEPHEKPPHSLAAALGAQVVSLVFAGVLVAVLAVSRGAGLGPQETAWLIFAALLSAGVGTWIQATRVGVIGSGYVLFAGANVAFVTVATSAVQAGGLQLLATLGCVTALSCFLFTWKLGALRRILTPAVGGTVLMLMAIGIAPVMWDMMSKPPAGQSDGGSQPVVMVATLLPMALLALLARGWLRLWAPLLGVLAGSVTSVALGLVDFGPVLAAPWVGLPQLGWPGLALHMDAAAWGLLPGFVLISLVVCIETFADSIGVQRGSHRTERPIDFRAVQGAINADGAATFVSGLLAGVPTTVYSASASVMELTGVAARRVAYWGGGLLVLLAFFPKVAALVVAIPATVAGTYLFVLLALLFGHGLRMVTEDGLGFEEGLVVCLAFWVGLSFQEGGLLHHHLPHGLVHFLEHSTNSGGLTAILLMGLLTLRRRGRGRTTLPLEPESIAKTRPLLHALATRLGWDTAAENRLMLACEEAMLYLLEQRPQQGDARATERVHLRLAALEGNAEVELVCAPSGTNVQSAIAELPASSETDPEADLTLRLLKAMTRDIRHQQYHGVDYLLLHVDSRG